jgi:hypothetical protein
MKLHKNLFESLGSTVRGVGMSGGEEEQLGTYNKKGKYYFTANSRLSR